MNQVIVTNRQRRLAVRTAPLKAAAESVLHDEGYDGCQVTIALVSDRRIARWNRQYLQHEGPTDVMAFPGGEQPLDEESLRWLGDVIVSVDTAERQAPAWNRTTPEELAEYVIHGVLHLAGYDDKREPARSRMMRRQAALFRAWKRRMTASQS